MSAPHALIMKPLVDEANGRCVACDSPLPPPRKGRTPGGRPKRVVCGDAECWATYHELRRSRVRELLALGLQVELKRAAKAIRAANLSLARRRA